MSNAALKAAPSESNGMTGLERSDRKDQAETLSKVLSDSAVLYIKTLGVHWNIVGPLFYSVHKLTEEQYQDMAEAIDTIAERIRALGFTAPGSMQEFLQFSDIVDSEQKQSGEEMIQGLIGGNEMCAKSLREAALQADEAGDVKTADLLTERIGQHEENAWMLRAMLSAQVLGCSLSLLEQPTIFGYFLWVQFLGDKL